MTNNILNFIANETNGKCYQSFRYCADDEIRMPTLDYEDKGKEFTYKVDDIAIGKKIFPIVAGQVIVDCCERHDRDTFKKMIFAVRLYLQYQTISTTITEKIFVAPIAKCLTSKSENFLSLRKGELNLRNLFYKKKLYLTIVFRQKKF
jgi:hypothetical protein